MKKIVEFTFARPETAREREKKVRVFLFGEGPGAEATRQELQEMLEQILKALGWGRLARTARWSKFAGCSRCACSPGFILEVTAKKAGWAEMFATFVEEP